MVEYKPNPTSMVSPAGERPQPSMAVTSRVAALKNRQKASPPIPVAEAIGAQAQFTDNFYWQCVIGHFFVITEEQPIA